MTLGNQLEKISTCQTILLVSFGQGKGVKKGPFQASAGWLQGR